LCPYKDGVLIPGRLRTLLYYTDKGHIEPANEAKGPSRTQSTDSMLSPEYIDTTVPVGLQEYVYGMGEYIISYAIIQRAICPSGAVPGILNYSFLGYF
jgi:hypothetical protein